MQWSGEQMPDCWDMGQCFDKGSVCRMIGPGTLWMVLRCYFPRDSYIMSSPSSISSFIHSNDVDHEVQVHYLYELCDGDHRTWGSQAIFFAVPANCRRWYQRWQWWFNIKDQEIVLDESYNPLLKLNFEFETGHTTLRPPGDWALNGDGIAWDMCHYWLWSRNGNPASSAKESLEIQIPPSWCSCLLASVLLPTYYCFVR